MNNIHKKVRQLVADKKSKIKDKEFFISSVLRRHFEDIAFGVTQKYGNKRIKVNLLWDENPNAEIGYTNSLTVTLNAGSDFFEGTDRQERYKLLYGVHSHEEGHILYTDFTILKKMKENIMNYQKFYPDFPKEARWDIEVGEIKSYLKEPNKASIINYFLHDLHNIVEDGHIENRMMCRYTGDVKRCLTLMRNHQFEKIPTLLESIEKEEQKEDILSSILQHTLSYAKFGEIKFGGCDLNDERVQAIFSIMDEIDEYMVTMDAFKRAQIGNLIFIKLWNYYKPAIDYLVSKKENEQNFPQLQGATQQGSGGIPMASNEKTPINDNRNKSQTQQQKQKSSSQSNSSQEDNNEDGSSSSNTNQSNSQKNQQTGNSQSADSDNDDNTQNGASNSSQTDTEDENGGGGANSNKTEDDNIDGNETNGSDADSDDAEDNDANGNTSDAENGDDSDSDGSGDDGNDDSTDTSDEDGGTTNDTNNGDTDETVGNDSENDDAEEDTSDKEGSESDTGDSEEGDTDIDNSTEDSSDNGDTEDSDEDENNTDADEDDDIDGDEPNSNSSINQNHQKPSGNGSADEIDGDGDFEDDTDYQGDCDFDASKTIDDLLNEIAEEQATDDWEEDIKSEAQDLVDEIDYGDIHKKCNMVLHRQTEVSDSLIELYQKISPELLAISKGLARAVQQKLKDYQQGGKFTNLYFGRRIDKNNLVHTDGKIFYNNRLPQDLPQLSVGVLVDESGSMNSENRSIYARATALILYDFCQQLNIPITIIGHSDEADFYRKKSTMHFFDYCEFNSIDGRDKYRLMDIKARGCTRDGAALRFIGERLARRPEEQKILFVISDGSPWSVNYEGEPAEADIRGIVQEYEKKGIKTIALAIGDDKKDILSIYGEKRFLDITDLTQLPKTMTKKIISTLKVI